MEWAGNQEFELHLVQWDVIDDRGQLERYPARIELRTGDGISLASWDTPSQVDAFALGLDYAAKRLNAEHREHIDSAIDD